jgi:hypothetical protein
MKKTLLLLSISFLVLNCADVSAKCHVDCWFKVGSVTYYNNVADYSINVDTNLSAQQIISLQITYHFWDIGYPCEYDYPAYSWKKNGTFVSNAQIYTVTDTGLYEGDFATPNLNSPYDTIFSYITLHVGYSVTTSVNEIKNSSFINVYPNPFTSNFTLEIKTAKAFALSYQIYDCTGREIKEVKRENISGELKLIEDFESISKGIYFLRMKIGEAEFEKKLVRL